ncbi:MAG: cation:proton antiporter [Leptospirales bacterium]
MDSFAIYLFIFALGAFFVPIINRWLFIPGIVGEIIFGMAVQSFFTNAPEDLYLIDFLSQMGFIFLLFLAGLEINFDFFSREKILMAGLALILLYVISYIVWYFIGQPIGIYVILPITAISVGVPFIALKNAKSEKSSLGQNLILVTSVGELFSIIGMIVFEVYEHSGGADVYSIAINLSGVVLLALGAYVLIRLILLFFWWSPKSVLDLSGDGDTSELSVRLSFLLLMSMVAMAAFFKLELILGAFIGGMILSYVFRSKAELEKKLSSIGYGFFIPFFFIKIGWDFHFTSGGFQSSLLIALALYGIILLLRGIITIGFIPLLKGRGLLHTVRNFTGITLILAAPLTMLVAIGQLGYSLNIFTETFYNGIILCSMLGAIVGSTGFKLLFRAKE